MSRDYVSFTWLHSSSIYLYFMILCICLPVNGYLSKSFPIHIITWNLDSCLSIQLTPEYRNLVKYFYIFPRIFLFIESRCWGFNQILRKIGKKSNTFQWIEYKYCDNQSYHLFSYGSQNLSNAGNLNYTQWQTCSWFVL